MLVFYFNFIDQFKYFVIYYQFSVVINLLHEIYYYENITSIKFEKRAPKLQKFFYYKQINLPQVILK